MINFLGFPIKKDTNTRLTELENEVSELKDKLEKLSEDYSNKFSLLSKMVSSNIEKIDTLDELICEDIERLDNLECRMSEFDMSVGEDSIMFSISSKLEYIIKMLENK